MQSMAVQLVRNSIVHGSLQPEERIQAGKTDYINITASINETDGAYSLLVRDDGEGFDNQAILDRAVELGIIKAEQLDRINHDQAFKLIFQPGFSRLSEANLDGGRGVGLDVVHTMAKSLGGTIGVQHKHGRFCQFKVSIPKS
jgi:two-component system chemotaxis sensor kinase CheA